MLLYLLCKNVDILRQVLSLLYGSLILQHRLSSNCPDCILVQILQLLCTYSIKNTIVHSTFITALDSKVSLWDLYWHLSDIWFKKTQLSNSDGFDLRGNCNSSLFSSRECRFFLCYAFYFFFCRCSNGCRCWWPYGSLTEKRSYLWVRRLISILLGDVRTWWNSRISARRLSYRKWARKMVLCSAGFFRIYHQWSRFNDGQIFGERSNRDHKCFGDGTHKV